VLAAALGLPLAVLLIFVGPIPQDPTYHNFADRRSWLDVANVLNVASNVPFLLVGLAGLLLYKRAEKRAARLSWAVFFCGTALVAAGSAYYHGCPTNKTLVWDRLPMTLAFMGLLSALLTEYVNAKMEKPTLATTIVIGIASIVWWDRYDDLRLYVWVQFSPLLAILVLLALFPQPYSHSRYLVYALVLYALAKVAELLDARIFEATSEIISGHTLKHLLAVGGIAVILAMLRVRKRAPPAARQ